MPILEVDENTWVSDSNAIVSHLIRSSPKSTLLGGSDFEQAQVAQWMDFLRTETLPIVKALQWQTFGQMPVTQNDYNQIYASYKDHMKIINKHLNGKTHFVANSLSVADIYFALSQVEMMQIIMDGNFRNSINNVNALFKSVGE